MRKKRERVARFSCEYQHTPELPEKTARAITDYYRGYLYKGKFNFEQNTTEAGKESIKVTFEAVNGFEQQCTFQLQVQQQDLEGHLSRTRMFSNKDNVGHFYVAADTTYRVTCTAKQRFEQMVRCQPIYGYKPQKVKRPDKLFTVKCVDDKKIKVPYSIMATMSPTLDNLMFDGILHSQEHTNVKVRMMYIQRIVEFCQSGDMKPMHSDVYHDLLRMSTFFRIPELTEFVCVRIAEGLTKSTFEKTRELAEENDVQLLKDFCNAFSFVETTPEDDKEEDVKKKEDLEDPVKKEEDDPVKKEEPMEDVKQEAVE